MKQPLISVIVPIYNAERYLEKCINSIVRQSYSELQIVLVNDGSKDGSLEICNQVAKVDKRIRIVNQENCGVVSARKAGVLAASGEYICWVDADDWIESNYIERLIKTQVESSADIVAVAHFYDIGNDSVLVKNGVENGTYPSSDIIKNMLCTGDFFEYGITPQLYTKLFRASILKQAQIAVVEDIIAGDDAAVVYPAILKSQSVCVADYAGYHYVQNQGSITKVRYENEYGKVQRLIDYLHDEFEKSGVLYEMQGQLHKYKNYLLALRQIEYFDRRDVATVLSPFGGLGRDSRIIIYGAGVLGQNIYNYLRTREEICVVDWLDKNYDVYRQKGLNVNGPQKIKEYNGCYDYVIIANITQRTAMTIKEFLLTEGVSEDAICWFTEEFRTGSDPGINENGEGI